MTIYNIYRPMKVKKKWVNERYFKPDINRIVVYLSRKSCPFESISEIKVEESSDEYIIYFELRHKLTKEEISVAIVNEFFKVIQNIDKAYDFVCEPDKPDLLIEGLRQLDRRLKNKYKIKELVDTIMEQEVFAIPFEPLIKNWKITSIQVNEKDRITTCVFEDGDVRMVKCLPDEEMDLYTAVCLCIAYHTVGSKSKIRKMISQTPIKTIQKPIISKRKNKLK